MVRQTRIIEEAKRVDDDLRDGIEGWLNRPLVR